MYCPGLVARVKLTFPFTEFLLLILYKVESANNSIGFSAMRLNFHNSPSKLLSRLNGEDGQHINLTN